MNHRLARGIGWIALWLLTLVSFAPLVSLFGSLVVADMLGCQVDEGSVHPCVVAGVEIGSALYTGTVLGWAALVTMPGMALALLIWVIVIGRALALRLRRRHETRAGA